MCDRGLMNWEALRVHKCPILGLWSVHLELRVYFDHCLCHYSSIFPLKFHEGITNINGTLDQKICNAIISLLAV